MKGIDPIIINECKIKLLSIKADLLNRLLAHRGFFKESLSKVSGDEVDQTVAQLEENNLLIAQDRMRSQLLEIEYALAKIENGNFGICEETDELIDADRLRALPWTRLSIEGAELREAISKRAVASKKC